MNLPANHGISDAVLAAINNPIGEAGDPVIPFVYRQPPATNMKIQVDDRSDDGKNQAKRVVYLPYFGLHDTATHSEFLALKHAFEAYHHIKGLEFYSPKKRGELFYNSLLGTAASRWESIVHDMIDVPAYQPTLVYFKKCLRQWVKLYFGKDARKRHFTFMRAKGSMVKDRRLKIDEYAFWEAIYLYNEIGDFL